VDVRRNPKHHLARIWLLRRFADLGTRLDIVVYGLAKGGSQVHNVVGVEGYTVVNPSDLTEENAFFVVEVHAGRISII
jgi:hypothetical protein